MFNLAIQLQHFSCPPERIVQRFLEIVEDSPGAVAVHCKVNCLLLSGVYKIWNKFW